jgi:hypothetical protein
MKKEIGKWLLDVAKYVTTAIIISSFLGSFEQKWLVYTLGGIIILLCFLTGLYFINDKNK